MDTVRTIKLEQDFAKFFRYWSLAAEIVQQDNGTLNQRLLRAWSKSICCLAPRDVPSEYFQHYVLVRTVLMKYRFAARWSSDAAETIPDDVAKQLERAFINPGQVLLKA